MMVAMMLPSATLMVLRYAHVGRATAFDTNPLGPTGWFAAGYLLIWFGFAFAATNAQWALERAAFGPSNKGFEAAMAAIEMATLQRKLRERRSDGIKV